VVVLRDRWEICEHARFGGQCVVLRPGRYASLQHLGLNDRVSSVRMVSQNTSVEGSRYAPYPVAAAYDNQRRHGERLYEANVSSVREVFATPQQRCWVEHQQGAQDRGGVNVPGAVVGAVLGGVLGHQVGSGHGNDAATVGGAVVGGAVGANVGRNGGPSYSQDVQRCETTPTQGRVDHYDVAYDFRGTQHRIQMTSPPGKTLTVNAQGEPRA
jgi:uncharacterized protein YcfJ